MKYFLFFLTGEKRYVFLLRMYSNKDPIQAWWTVRGETREEGWTLYSIQESSRILYEREVRVWRV